MKCGNCNGTEFEVTAGTAHCTNCGASVPNEVAAAIQLGLEPEEGDEDDAS